MATKVLAVFGTRPEAIKMAPLLIGLARDARFERRICLTGQHREMLGQALDAFDIVADHDLAVMRPDQSPSDVAAAVLAGLPAIVSDVRPDIVLVHGDTATTAAATMAAYYANVAVGHVEAGLRTHDLRAPWPEEGNRRIASTLAALHFAPTERAAANLRDEGIDAATIHVTGNTAVDALLLAIERLRQDPALAAAADRALPALRDDRRLLLVTGHRRESMAGGFERICRALALLARRYGDVDIVYPVHLNPRVRDPVFHLLGKVPNVHLLEPLPYLSMVRLMARARLILTDSGGIQEEAPSLGVPVLVMRDTTERRAGIEAGTAQLVGTDTAAIVAAAANLLDEPATHARMGAAHNPYGDGLASIRIADALARWSGPGAMRGGPD